MKQNLSLFKTPNEFRGRSKFTVQLWWIVQATLFRMSPQVLYGWRNLLLRCFGAEIGRKVIIRPSARFTYPWKVKIGDYSWVGDDVVFYSLGNIFIGKNVVISQKTYLCTGSHNYKRIDFPISEDSITIEDECWLATDVYVAPGVNIKKGAIVGARSSVFCDLESNKIYFGTPAKFHKER
ncbi:putative colanic acid biosynthesis acetyltransferase [Confluentibacter citreus]|uniref:putative colanic acid biosynthesis acetyltransferase n=1 Tax=Confluentibacter citreus TaxID=2007307 RepID=UPI000C289228|nr:putative colanic acid biosynthesis acetyltransferase [Confluentibacter citreus]